MKNCLDCRSVALVSSLMTLGVSATEDPIYMDRLSINERVEYFDQVYIEGVRTSVERLNTFTVENHLVENRTYVTQVDYYTAFELNERDRPEGVTSLKGGVVNVEKNKVTILALSQRHSAKRVVFEFEGIKFTNAYAKLIGVDRVASELISGSVSFLEPIIVDSNSFIIRYSGDSEVADNFTFGVGSVGDQFEFTTGVPQITLTQAGGSVISENAAVGFGALADDANEAERTRTYTISNPGSAELVVSNIALSGVDAASFEVVDNSEIKIPAGGSAMFSVRFKEEQPVATYQASVTLTHDADEMKDDANSEFVVNISATQLEPPADIAVFYSNSERASGQSLDLGYLDQDAAQKNFVFKIKNTREGDLTEISATLNGEAATDALFSVDVIPSDSAPGGFTLSGVNEEETFTLVFSKNPGLAGDKYGHELEGNLVISSSDSDEGMFTIPFKVVLYRDGEGDADNDGVLNLDEIKGGLKPNNADSNGNGVTDGVELAAAGVFGNEDLELTNEQLASLVANLSQLAAAAGGYQVKQGEDAQLLFDDLVKVASESNDEGVMRSAMKAYLAENTGTSQEPAYGNYDALVADVDGAVRPAVESYVVKNFQNFAGVGKPAHNELLSYVFPIDNEGGSSVSPVKAQLKKHVGARLAVLANEPDMDSVPNPVKLAVKDYVFPAEPVGESPLKNELASYVAKELSAIASNDAQASDETKALHLAVGEYVNDNFAAFTAALKADIEGYANANFSALVQTATEPSGKGPVRDSLLTYLANDNSLASVIGDSTNVKNAVANYVDSNFADFTAALKSDIEGYANTNFSALVQAATEPGGKGPVRDQLLSYLQIAANFESLVEPSFTFIEVPQAGDAEAQMIPQRIPSVVEQPLLDYVTTNSQGLQLGSNVKFVTVDANGQVQLEVEAQATTSLGDQSWTPMVADYSVKNGVITIKPADQPSANSKQFFRIQYDEPAPSN